MEDRSCLGCGCGCISIMVVLTILFFLAVCGLIIWANFAFADGQYQLQFGGLLLTALVPIA
ncbi:MAG: hypothetical protein AAGU15_09860 [Anaerolineaceae bacterium]